MDYNVIEIDGVQPNNGRLPVDALVNVSSIGSRPIFVTHHEQDDERVTYWLSSDEGETLYKTYTIPNSYLRLLFISLSRKEVTVSIYVDDVKLSSINVEHQYDGYKHRINWNGYIGYPSFGVFKNYGKYVVYFAYENTPVNSDVKIKLASLCGCDIKVSITNVDYTYNTIPD